ncbi:hypothetical protein FKW77_000799 [Venturia effusa]|uniref:Uncharacterized protein n=1 Tax=Venturia effusa TaxID=50376 RepID=A0A517LRE2_9PEZI|nr:hypothetical protein FKW77_000799 [Venturia effusa]
MSTWSTRFAKETRETSEWLSSEEIRNLTDSRNQLEAVRQKFFEVLRIEPATATQREKAQNLQDQQDTAGAKAWEEFDPKSFNPGDRWPCHLSSRILTIARDIDQAVRLVTEFGREGFKPDYDLRKESWESILHDAVSLIEKFLIDKKGLNVVIANDATSFETREWNIRNDTAYEILTGYCEELRKIEGRAFDRVHCGDEEKEAAAAVDVEDTTKAQSPPNNASNVNPRQEKVINSRENLSTGQQNKIAADQQDGISKIKQDSSRMENESDSDEETHQQTLLRIRQRRDEREKTIVELKHKNNELEKSLSEQCERNLQLMNAQSTSAIDRAALARLQENVRLKAEVSRESKIASTLLICWINDRSTAAKDRAALVTENNRLKVEYAGPAEWVIVVIGILVILSLIIIIATKEPGAEIKAYLKSIDCKVV